MRAAAAAVVLLMASAAAAGDFDGDSLDDDFEQALLEKFRPTLLLSAGECDGMPAEFTPGSVAPRAARKNGTLYGRAFPRGSDVELHYFHRWARDCGRGGHALDVEHVSALVRGDGTDASTWRAAYWHAAAHQDTVCDAAHGARAAALGAADRGALVWVSEGKHASYLSIAACNAGCGSDRCAGVVLMPPGALINLGEKGRPLHGTVWTASKQWPFASKFVSDFPDAALARMDAASGTELVLFNPALRPAHAFVLGGNSTIDGLATGERHTGKALDTASQKAESAVSTGIKATVRSLEKSRKKVVEFLGGKPK
jgi:hypothetical protein